ncbi:hypothetical protein JZU69_01110, partial [bacterium]|nr:hypothetical protein [bacterium]
AYAAAHHPELRLHRFTKADWDRLENLLSAPPKPEPQAVQLAPISPVKTGEPQKQNVFTANRPARQRTATRPTW